MYIFIIILLVVGLFLVFTGSIKIRFLTKEERQEIEDFLSNLIEGDRITALIFNDKNASHRHWTELYTVVKNNPDIKEIMLQRGHSGTPFIAAYDSHEFKRVVQRNGDVVLDIIKRKEAEKKKN